METPISWSDRPTYSADQLNQYFDRIHLPTQYRESFVIKHGAIDNDDALDFLAVLQRYQLAAIPFENLNLHYSVHRTISTDPQDLFDKIVTLNRGGYCMENNTLFGTVLGTLGYNVMSAGGRVNEAVQPIAASKTWTGPKYDGWNHMVNIVAIGERKYLIDVGFGSNGPHQPTPLIDKAEFDNVGDQSGRLVYGPILQHTRPGQFLWQYEIRNGDAAWMPAYCFTEAEFLPEDFTIINYYMSTSRASWFTFHVVCVRMLMDETGHKIVGDITLFNHTLKRRLGAQSEIVHSFISEKDRVTALESFFHISLSRAQINSIRHHSSEIL
ncbi:arylamine N-acetyltransferase 2 [Penicillium verhagenii]|nr:arylamine N-acetyltransferase 2 [Penicillium verhagenii]